MNKQEWREFRGYFHRVHNIHVKLAERKIKQSASPNQGVATEKQLKILKACLIDKDDTAQLCLLKQMFFWIDLGHLSSRIEAIAAVPDHWQLRPEAQRPQLVIMFAEKKANGKLGKPMYAINIPHYEHSKAPSNSPLPGYKKGQWEGILTLNDNSKVVVNAVSELEAKKVLNAAEKAIDSKYLKGSQTKIGMRKGIELKEIEVMPVKAKYFPTGRKDLSPKSVSKFR